MRLNDHGSKLLRYNFIKPKKSIIYIVNTNTLVIYHGIFTTEIYCHNDITIIIKTEWQIPFQNIDFSVKL